MIEWCVLKTPQTLCEFWHTIDTVKGVNEKQGSSEGTLRGEDRTRGGTGSGESVPHRQLVLHGTRLAGHADAPERTGAVLQLAQRCAIHTAAVLPPPATHAILTVIYRIEGRRNSVYQTDAYQTDAYLI